MLKYWLKRSSNPVSSKNRKIYRHCPCILVLKGMLVGRRHISIVMSIKWRKHLAIVTLNKYMLVWRKHLLIVILNKCMFVWRKHLLIVILNKCTLVWRRHLLTVILNKCMFVLRGHLLIVTLLRCMHPTKSYPFIVTLVKCKPAWKEACLDCHIMMKYQSRDFSYFSPLKYNSPVNWRPHRPSG